MTSNAVHDSSDLALGSADLQYRHIPVGMILWIGHHSDVTTRLIQSSTVVKKMGFTLTIFQMGFRQILNRGISRIGAGCLETLHVGRQPLAMLRRHGVVVKFINGRSRVRV